MFVAGDEVALCIIANTVASMLTKVIVSILQPADSAINADDQFRNERVYSILSCAGISASLNIFVPSPLLSILVLHEILSSSSSSTSIASKSSTGRTQHSQNSHIINNQSMESYNIQGNNGSNEDGVTIVRNRSDNIFRHVDSTTTTRRTSSNSSCNELFWNNSYMEQITISTIATLSASIVTSALIPDQFGGGDDNDDVEELGTFSSSLKIVARNRRRMVFNSATDYLDDDEHTMLRHWGVASVLGVLCGGIVSLMLVLGSICKRIRVYTIDIFDRYCCCTKCNKYVVWIPKLFLPTLAGAIVGILATYVSPLTIGNDFTIFLEDNNGSDDFRVKPFGTIDWTSLATSKCLAVSLCLGLGGLLGGPVLPMVFIGKCIGSAISSSASTGDVSTFVSSNLALPCCVCACVGAILPSPLAIALIVAMEDDGPHLDLNQLSSLYLAAVVGYSVTGGFGFLRPCVVGWCCNGGNGNEEAQEDEVAYSMIPVNSSSSTPNNGISIDYQRSEDESSVTIEHPPSDYDIVNTVQSAIFGTQEQ